MWVSKTTWDRMNALMMEQVRELAFAHGSVATLTAANAKQHATLEWMAHRLNQVEEERAQLVQVVLGAKVKVPEIRPLAPDADKARETMEGIGQGMFADVGEDSSDPEDRMAAVVGREQDELGVDYSNLPGFKR